MRKLLAIGLITVAVLSGVVVVLKFGRSLPPEVAPGPVEVRPVSQSSNVSHLNVGGPTAPKEQRLERIESAPQQSEWEIVERLLARPKPGRTESHPLMRDVPRLSPETERKLIDLYYRSSNSSDKHRLLRILAFGGGASSCTVLINAITNEYRGKKVDGEWNAVLKYIPSLIGVLGREIPEASEFLMKGANLGFWSGVQFWVDDHGDSPGACEMAGACIKGLAVSGCSEASALISWYRDHPAEAIVVGTDGEIICRLYGHVVEAAFNLSIVQERGLEAVMNEVFCDFETYMKAFNRWWDNSPAGIDWQSWVAEVKQAARAKSARPANEPSR